MSQSQPFEIDLDLPEYSSKFPLKIDGETYTATCPSNDEAGDLMSRFASLGDIKDPIAQVARADENMRAFFEALQLPSEVIEKAMRLRTGAKMAIVKKVFVFLNAAS